MKILCPKCGKIYEVESDLEGEKVECACGRSFIATEIEFENKPKDMVLTEEEKKKKQMQNGCLGCLVIIVIVFLLVALFPNACSTPLDMKDVVAEENIPDTCDPVIEYIKGRLYEPHSLRVVFTQVKQDFDGVGCHYVFIRFKAIDREGQDHLTAVAVIVKSGKIKEFLLHGNDCNHVMKCDLI